MWWRRREGCRLQAVPRVLSPGGVILEDCVVRLMAGLPSHFGKNDQSGPAAGSDSRVPGLPDRPVSAVFWGSFPGNHDIGPDWCLRRFALRITGQYSAVTGEVRVRGRVSGSGGCGAGMAIWGDGGEEWFDASRGAVAPQPAWAGPMRETGDSLKKILELIIFLTSRIIFQCNSHRYFQIFSDTRQLLQQKLLPGSQ
jgi:hypothetical protein